MRELTMEEWPVYLGLHESREFLAEIQAEIRSVYELESAFAEAIGASFTADKWQHCALKTRDKRDLAYRVGTLIADYQGILGLLVRPVVVNRATLKALGLTASRMT